ncbi:MAG: universal stress protein, partial [Acidimicrobiales bacterium]
AFRSRLPSMYERILVGTDGSSTAAKAVERAVQVADITGASLTILSAASPERGATVVTAEAEKHKGSGVAIDTKVIDEDAVTALIEEARDGHFDLLVMGNKGMTGLTRFFRLGSVPNKVTHHLPCSLLIVKTT